MPWHNSGNWISILGTLRTNKSRLKTIIESAHLEGLTFRKINDPGECATLLTIQLDDQKSAEAVAQALGSKTIIRSGWHVYGNMEQILAHRDEKGRFALYPHMLPKTDDILAGRSI